MLAYDAVFALAAALEALGPLDDENLRGNLAETRVRVQERLCEVNIDGASGPISFDEHGDRERGGVFVKVVKGKQSLFPFPNSHK